jgi:hypothetical protein
MCKHMMLKKISLGIAAIVLSTGLWAFPVDGDYKVSQEEPFSSITTSWDHDEYNTYRVSLEDHKVADRDPDYVTEGTYVSIASTWGDDNDAQISNEDDRYFLIARK